MPKGIPNNPRITKSKCKICGEKVLTNSLAAHVCTDHRDYAFHFNGNCRVYTKKVYYCPVNTTWYSNRNWLSRGLTECGWSNEEYLLTYGEQYMPDVWDQIHNHPKHGQATSQPFCTMCEAPVKFDEGHWKYPRFCSFSCSTTWHAKYTNRVDEAQKTFKANKENNPDHALTPVSIRYWTKRGLTETEAKEKIATRQATNKLARFIDRYGEEEGTKRWLQRQERWLVSMKESGMHAGVSNVSNDLFQKIELGVPGIKFGNNEVVIRTKEKAVKVDCILRSKKKIIEFYGDYWHANPSKYGPDDLIRRNIKANTKWESDSKRLELLKESGFDVLIIWESEYINNPIDIVDKCIRFLE